MRAQSRWSWKVGAALVALAAALVMLPVRASADDAIDVNGSWKLIRLRIVEAELLTFDVKEAGGKISAFIAEPAALRDNLVDSFVRKGDAVSVKFSINGNEIQFRGRVGKDHVVLGSLNEGSAVYPARLVKTDDKILAQPRPPQDLFQAYNAVEQARDPKVKADKLAEILHAEPGAAKLSMLYAELLRYATLADEPAERVQKYADEWIQSADPYGAEWAFTVRNQALKILRDKKPYAALALRIAEQTEKQLGSDATLEQRAETASLLASAAKLAGKPEIYEQAEARSKTLEAELDADYLKKMPPFKPEAFAGRKNKTADRVVLLELFTGAQCPPCVAADAAFDALNLAYKPSELITLQYHLHVPGPDPLTSPASTARQEYFDVNSTPTAYLNGAPRKGGGFMQHAQTVYDGYREVIDKLLEQKKEASIELKVARAGDEITINASAHAKANGADAPTAPKGGLKLRLVLAEEQIHYVGGNKLRFHHHVVRAMPGGPAGKALDDGEAKLDVTVKLSELQKSLEAFLDSSVEDRGSFANPVPPFAFKDLFIVAFVQDEGDKSVLHAVSVPVAEGKVGAAAK